MKCSCPFLLAKKIMLFPLRHYIIKIHILMKIRLKAAQELSVRAMEQSGYLSLLGLYVLVSASHRPPSFNYLSGINNAATGHSNHQSI